MTPFPDPSPQARAIVLIAVLLVIAAVVLWRQRSRFGPGSTPPAGRLLPWLRWLAPGATEPSLRVLQSSRLTARASVHVLRWDGREWLIGCSDQSVTLLGERQAPASGRGAPSPASGAPSQEPNGSVNRDHDGDGA